MSLYVLEEVKSVHFCLNKRSTPRIRLGLCLYDLTDGTTKPVFPATYDVEINVAGSLVCGVKTGTRVAIKTERL